MDPALEPGFFHPQMLCQLHYISVKSLDQNMKLEGAISKAAFLSDTNCKFQGVPQSTLHFNNSIELTELTESNYTQGYSLLEGKDTE